MLQDLANEHEMQTGKVNISALSKMTGLDRKTIRKYLSKPRDYPHQYRHLKAGKLDPFKEYLSHSAPPLKKPDNYAIASSPHYIKAHIYISENNIN